MGLGGDGVMPSSRGPQSRNSFCRTWARSCGFSWRLEPESALLERKVCLDGGWGLFSGELEELFCVFVCDDDGEHVALTVF